MLKGMIMAAAVAAMALVSADAMAKGGLNLKTREVTGVININNASARELELLPGVGAKTARLIVGYREKQSFKAPADIMKVKGIGEGTFRKIKNYVTVAGPTTLAVKHGGSAPDSGTASSPKPEKPAGAAAPVAAK